MLNITSASLSVGPDGKIIEKPRLQPLREYELFGLPKSTKKPERPRLEPVRLKDLFGSPQMKKTTKTLPARRMTTMPVARSNTGKKLHHGQKTPGAVSATSAFIYNKTSGMSHLQGLSKSDGKISKTKGLGHERLKSEATKEMLKVWEASQTVQPSARKSRPAEARGQNVRRKLYSAAQKLPASENIEVVESKEVRPEVRGTIKPRVASRKSCLPQPNSIRDKYINQRQNEAIREESTLSTTIENEPTNAEVDSCDEAAEGSKVSEKFVETENSDGREENKAPEGSSRPTVIVERSTKDERREKGDDFNDIVPLSTSRPPLQELHQNKSSLRPKLDSNSSLPEDSRGDRGESFCCENLPQNSFLELTIPTKDSWVKIDRQTLTWIHGNLKLNIQSTEEQLFTMKLVLKAIEDTMRGHDCEEDRRTMSDVRNSSTSSSAPIVEAEINGASEIVPEIETTENIVNTRPEIPFVPEERKIEDSMNDREGSIIEDLVDEDKENRGESSRRRSARLAEKMCKTPKSRNDSFSQFEHELNIIHVKTKKRNDSPVPVKSIKRIDPRSRKSIREYMALKSSINFLATPDVRGFPTPKGEKDTPLHRQITRRSLSRKLLTELDELYADSPS